jgi:hypothetical protein
MFWLNKKIGCFLFSLILIQSVSHAQLLRRLRDEAKWKLEQKAKEKMNHVIDKTVDKAVDSIGTKKDKKEKPKRNRGSKEVENNLNESGVKDVTPPAKHKENGGFIELHTSTNSIFAGGTLTFTGKSINYKDYNKVEVVIKNEHSYKEQSVFVLQKDGSFTGVWYAPSETGKYTMTATSSDKKASTTEEITVYGLSVLKNMASENITLTKQAQKALQERVEKVKPMISSQQATKLDEKMKAVDKNVDQTIKLLEHINNANQKIGEEIQKGQSLPRNLSDNLSELESKLKQNKEELKNQQEFINHQPFDNTICEYLVMINEACAAFSTFSSLWAGSIAKIAKSVIIGAVPGTMGSANKAMGNPIPTGPDFVAKEGTKMYLVVKDDANALSQNLTKANFANDVIGFVSDILLKFYCGTYEGSMTQTFNFNYKNKYGDSWWKYGGTLEAKLNLRYPKNANTGRIIKMKGSLEGNATKFTFFADPKEAVADELKSAYNSTVVVTIADIKAIAIPFVSAKNDIAGFGAVARGLVTPSAFYIPIDAEYNLDNKQIKFFINSAILDFTPLIKNRKIFVVIAALPMFKWEDFPIEKAQKIIHGSLKEKNWFTVTGEESGKPHFEGTITRKVNQPDFTIDLSIIMKAEKN